MIAATQSNHPLAGVQCNRESALELACARLRAAQMRVTKPRIAILSALAKRREPIAIEDLHATLEASSCDLVTVYRCLAAFEEIRLVRRSYHYSGTCLYELSLSDRPEHYHVTCRECGGIEAVDYFPVDGVEGLLRQRGYSQLTHLVEFFGLCPACQQKAVARAGTAGITVRRE